MTNVLVALKRVPDSSGEVLLTADGQGVDGRYVGFTISNHELCAVELAVQIAGASGGEATVVTVGTEDAAEQLRSALALGLHGRDARGRRPGGLRARRRRRRDRRRRQGPRGRGPRATT